MKIVVQNLQKKHGLASKLIDELQPDVFLAQEVNLSSETRIFQAHSTSRMGYGTAIHSKGTLRRIQSITSPHAEFGGFIYKKTTVAECMGGTQVVSFHGYNGQPMKNVTKLVDHVSVVLKLLTPDPAVFAGDFNSWSVEHVDAITRVLEEAGFYLAYSWAYPGRDIPLDHAFLRDLTLTRSSCFQSDADHQGAILEVERG